MQTFGDYTILDRLGAGALGELFRARDNRVGRTVALRLVAPEIAADPDRRAGLLADAARAAGFSHPHIAALFDFGEVDGRLYLAHEFVPGHPLQASLTGRAFEPALALELAVQLADALAEGHRHGVVHADLRPSTIYITPTDQAKILDFGLAAWTSGGAARKAVARRLAGGGQPSGAQDEAVVPYLSPEQVLGGQGDPRTDVFSLGTILYQMATGWMPFEGGNPAGTAVKILQCSPPPPARRNPALPAGFDAITARTLAKSLDARYPDGSAMAADLRALAQQMNVRVSAEVHSRPPEARAGRARRPARRLVAAGVVALVLAALAALAWYGRDAIGGLFARNARVPRPVVAVLPFGTASGDAASAYIGTGFAEDLAARLGEIPGLSVVDRTAIRDVPPPSLQEIAQRTGAVVALEGVVRPGRYSIHVDAQLVEAATGRVLWERHYAREPRRASAAEAEIARQVADCLGLPVPTGNRWGRAQLRQVDPLAFDLYLRARDAAARRDRRLAIDLYHQALDKDGSLVEAHVGLSGALYLENFYSGADGDATVLERARSEADAALAVDPEMPQAHLVAAESALTVSAAISSLARALALDPSLGEAWHYAGDLVIDVDPARAITFYRRALALDPGIDASRRDIAAALEALDRFPEAEQVVAQGQAVRPDRPWWNQMRARLRTAGHDYDGAVALVAGSPATESVPLVWLAARILPLQMASRTGEAVAEATRLVARYPWFCEGQAVLAGLQWDTGSRDRARASVNAIVTRASAPDAAPSLVPCAALASAAIGEASDTAGYLARLARNDAALRGWTRQAVFGPSVPFRRRWYPWNKVADSLPVRQASTELSASLDRIRDEAARRLPAPPSAPSSSAGR